MRSSLSMRFARVLLLLALAAVVVAVTLAASWLTRPLTLAGDSAAAMSEINPPIELPTRMAGPPVTRSTKRVRSARFVWLDAESPTDGVRPKPGRSMATTRAWRASFCPTDIQLTWAPPSPWISTIAGPLPP